jgi:hypothetical protein
LEKSTSYEAPHCVVFSNLLSLLSLVQYSQHPARLKNGWENNINTDIKEIWNDDVRHRLRSSKLNFMIVFL